MRVCPSCKREVGYGKDYCPYCSAKLDAEPNAENGAQEVYNVGSNFKISTIHVFIMIGVFLFIVLLGLRIAVGLGEHLREKKCIDIVSSGCLAAYPDIELEKAFNTYFDDGSWIYATSNGVDYVTYVGTKSGKSKEIKIQFAVNLGKKYFTLEYAGTGEKVYDSEMWDTMDTIMNEYYRIGA